MVGRNVDGFVRVLAELGLVVDDLHRAATEHVRRAHEHRVAEALRDHERLFYRAQPCAPSGCLRPSSLHDGAEALAVLCEVDGVGAGAENVHAEIRESSLRRA